MSNVEATLREFGQSMGIDEVAFNEHGVAHFSIDQIGELYFETCPNGKCVVYVVREHGHLERGQLVKALELCHLEERNPMPVNVALRGEHEIYFGFRLAEEDFIIPNIEEGIAMLNTLHDRI
jgi:type III secretion system chaperone SycN